MFHFYVGSPFTTLVVQEPDFGPFTEKKILLEVMIPTQEQSVKKDKRYKEKTNIIIHKEYKE